MGRALSSGIDRPAPGAFPSITLSLHDAHMFKRFPDDWRRKRKRQEGAGDFQRRLRYRIVGLLHAGRLRPGDRLPSIRELADESELDHRAVASAYRGLERDGLVEIRPTSGVFVASGTGKVGLPPETARWVAEFLLSGWERRLSRFSISDLVSRCASYSLRCGCIESNEDHMVALTAELEADFSLEPVRLTVDPDADTDALPPERLQDVDLVVTSVFHGDLARTAAALAHKPVVVITFHEEFTRELDRRLREKPLTTVMVDPRYAVRGQAYLAVTGHRDRVRFVCVDELHEEPLDLGRDDVMITRAARRRLGLEDYHLITSPPSVISAESASELYSTIAMFGLQREPGRGPAASGG
jgi:DNA-binding transcriptional regulator YhcF (GntR family)